MPEMRSDSCVFCKIIEGKIPSTKVYEDDKVLGFKDIQPQAPVHYVFIPKQHVESLAKVNNSNISVLESTMLALIKTAEKEGLSQKGFRTVINTNEWGGQTVFHLHVHLLSGKQLGGGMVGGH